MQSHPSNADQSLGALPPNLVILGGTVAAEPEVGQRPSGQPVVWLRLEHPIPGEEDGSSGRRLADTAVLVLQRIVDMYPGQLRAGATVLIIGHELGGGDVFADALVPTAL
jgi:primosomal replication protein N